MAPYNSRLSSLFSSYCTLSAVTSDVDPSSPIIRKRKAGNDGDRNTNNNNNVSDDDSDENGWLLQTTSFYLDGSGRASFALPLVLECQNEDVLRQLIQAKCLPSTTSTTNVAQTNKNDDETKEEEGEDNAADDQAANASIHFQMRCQPATTTDDDDDAKDNATTSWNTKNTVGAVSVEGVTILSSQIMQDQCSILFDTQVVIRAHSGTIRKQQQQQHSKQPSITGTTADESKHSQVDNNSSNNNNDNKLDQVTTMLEVTAILSEQEPMQQLLGPMMKTATTSSLSVSTTTASSNETTMNRTSATTAFPGSIALGLASLLPLSDVVVVRNNNNNNNPGSLSTHGTLQTWSTPLKLHATLTNALSISVKSLSGSALGSTLVSLTIRHSNKHTEPVTITNIALHPRHSRLDVSLYDNNNNNNKNQYLDGLNSQQPSNTLPGSVSSSSSSIIVDMSKAVKWGYAPGTELRLPLVLYPDEAYATVLTIEAGENLSSHSYVSPISINAKVGVAAASAAADDESKGTTTASSSSTNASRHHQRFLRPGIVVSSDAQWTSGRVAIEPTDAFRVDMSVKENSCLVGAPVVVSLRVQNLSKETRDLMLLMAKDDEKKTTPASPSHSTTTATTMQRQKSIASTAVVSEVNGYTFGVWGLSAGDDGTIRHSRDQDLLAVDAALLLGEVKGQHSIDAELRFVPLREGTLDVPNLKLYDKRDGKWYNCIHKLKIIAASKV